MHPAYFETRFRTAGRSVEWPARFAILSACATTGEQWTQELNEAQDQRLREDLEKRGGFLERIVGYSPSTGHAEPSWAVDLPLEEACRIGRQYRQDAIYYVSTDLLQVVECASPQTVCDIGPFRKRVDQVG